MAIRIKKPVQSALPGMPAENLPVEPERRRTRGERKGLTREAVMEAARRVLATRSGPISVKHVAAALEVTHNSISDRLRRNKTTLERELGRAFLDDLSRPMLPGEDWHDHLRDLFREALRECEANPGLARVVTLWIAQTPHSSRPFTERVLHVLGAAGLPPEECGASYDVVLAALSGMLAVRFPEFDGNPEVWAAAVEREMGGVHQRYWPLMYLNRERLAASASAKVAAACCSAKAPQHGFADTMADLVVAHIQSKLKEMM